MEIIHALIYSGTNNVAKQMLTITQGRVRDKGVTWFPELVDKSLICRVCIIICMLPFY